MDNDPTNRVKIFTVAHVPAELRQVCLQYLRDFDTAHPECHFEVMSGAPDMMIQETVEQIRINPALSFGAIFERKEE